MTASSKTSLLLAHASEDRAIVERFYRALGSYSDLSPWLDIQEMRPGDDCRSTTQQAVINLDRIVVFWSKYTLKKFRAARRNRHQSGIGLELLTLLETSHSDTFIPVCLDRTALPKMLTNGHKSARVYVDANGLLEPLRADYGHIVWRAVNEIVGSVRRRPPLYTSLDLVATKGEPFEPGSQSYFEHSWIDGHDAERSGPEYIECLQVIQADRHNGSKIPATLYDDGCRGYRFAILDHTERGFWSAAISFGLADVGWCSVDLSNYTELRFSARASNQGSPLAVSFTDNFQGRAGPSTHNETSKQYIELGPMWRSAPPWIVKLDEFDWGINGHYGNAGPVDRSHVLQIVFNNGSRLWEQGRCWIEVRNIVLL